MHILYTVLSILGIIFFIGCIGIGIYFLGYDKGWKEAKESKTDYWQKIEKDYNELKLKLLNKK